MDKGASRSATGLAEASSIASLRQALERIADKIERQATCLEGYAEQAGHEAKPVPSVFHFQAMHFRDYAAEIRASLKQ